MTHLTPGEKAPDFTAKDQNGNNITLSDYRGKHVILYFYPKDNTPGCTTEACNFRDHYSELQEKGFVVLGVSADSQKKHQNFIDKYDLPFPLIADEDKDVIQAYGVWGPKKFMGKEFMGIHRTTFVIDPEGVVEQVIKKVKNKEASEQIMAKHEAQD